MFTVDPLDLLHENLRDQLHLLRRPPLGQTSHHDCAASSLSPDFSQQRCHEFQVIIKRREQVLNLVFQTAIR